MSITGRLRRLIRTAKPTPTTLVLSNEEIKELEDHWNTSFGLTGNATFDGVRIMSQYHYDVEQEVEKRVAEHSERPALKTFNQIDQVWEAYCEMTDVEIGQRIRIEYNPSEFSDHKVRIFCNGDHIYISKWEAKMLAEKLYYLTFDESPEGDIK
jgi:hypothetical protein